MGPVDLAAIPIGSYEPRWHMHLQHTDPEGAVRMALQMHVRKSIGVHWGTWLMSDEACECSSPASQYYSDDALVMLISWGADNKPPLDLELARQLLDVSENQFSVVPVGKTIVHED